MLKEEEEVGEREKKLACATVMLDWSNVLHVLRASIRHIQYEKMKLAIMRKQGR